FPYQSPPYRVFPVCCMNGNFPDVMSTSLGTPSRFAHLKAAKGTTQVRTVPGGAVISFVQHTQQKLDFRLSHRPSGFGRVIPIVGSAQYSTGKPDCCIAKELRGVRFQEAHLTFGHKRIQES